MRRRGWRSWMRWGEAAPSSRPRSCRAKSRHPREGFSTSLEANGCGVPGVKLSDWLHDAAARLAAVSDSPRLDAELIAAHAAGLEREAMLLHLRDMGVPGGA